MLKINVHVILGPVVGAAVAIAFALAPQLAQAQAPGALTQLGGPNSCIQVSSDSPECPTDTAEGLNSPGDVAVTPDGNNVYAIGGQYDDGGSEDSIVEFTRNPDGSLTYIGCIADSSAQDASTCGNEIATGLVDPEAIAISPDGDNVYVAAEDSNGDGDIAEFARNADGTLTQLSDNDCIAENEEDTGGCDVQGAHGLEDADDLVVSPDGDNVYVADGEPADAVTTLTRDTTDGSLSEAGDNPAADCIQDEEVDSDECAGNTSGLSEVTGVAISPDGDNVYTTGAPDPDADGSIAEFSREEGGHLSAIGCIGTPEDFDDESCSSEGEVDGLGGVVGLVISPDGNNVYTASEALGGPIAEFSRNADGLLTQLASPNNCIEEANNPDDNNYGCGTTAFGIQDGYRLAITPDGSDVYAAASTEDCTIDDACDDIAEFSRDASTGALAQLPSPDSCIQDTSDEGSECPNENGTGLGGPGVAISPDGNNLYLTGTNDIAEFARGTHTLTVSLGGTGSGSVADGTGAIACPTDCSHAYTTDSAVTLTATPSSGSTFTGWSGACSGTGTCQVTMNADMAVTATFTSTSTPTPGAPTLVLTSAPTAITDAGAGFLGSVNPEGLPTTVYFQYGLDRRYSDVGASGPNYTGQTPAQQITGDFTNHAVGPVSVSGLLPNAVYHVRLVATNTDGTTYGSDATFTTALAPFPGAPTLGKTFNIKPISGLVLILIHGHLVPLTQLTQIGPGVTIDSLHGTFQLVISVSGAPSAGATAARTKTQDGKFGGAVVRLHQNKTGSNKGLTTVMMVESAYKGAPSQSICSAPGSASDAHAAKVSSKVIQLLHASAHGKFATSGRYSAATVRGTIWNTIARCDGTLVHAIKDEVVVTDFIRHKTIVLHAGQSYLAPGPPTG